MAWFIDESEVKRQGAWELLATLSEKLPGIHDLQVSLRQGSSPAYLGGQLWQLIQAQIIGQLEQIQQNVQRLELEQLHLKSDRDFWKRIAERNQTQTLRQKLDQAQIQLKEQTERTERVEQELETLHNALERERQISQKELAQCQQVLNEQAAIIAEQHQKLARLLGTDTTPERA